MSEVIVSRNGQVTLSKEIREELGIQEGDRMIVNHFENFILITKKDRSAWDRIPGGALPKNFESIRRRMRGDSRKRLKRLGIVE